MRLALLVVALLLAPPAFAEKVPAPPGKAPAPSENGQKPGAAKPMPRPRPRETPAQPLLFLPSPEAENYNYFHMMATDTLRDSIASPDAAPPPSSLRKTPKR